MDSGRWVGMKDITRYLGVSRETVVKLIEFRKMPGHRVGKCWKFPKAEIDKWIKSGSATDGDDKEKLS